MLANMFLTLQCQKSFSWLDCQARHTLQLHPNADAPLDLLISDWSVENSSAPDSFFITVCKVLRFWGTAGEGFGVLLLHIAAQSNAFKGSAAYLWPLFGTLARLLPHAVG